MNEAGEAEIVVRPESPSDAAAIRAVTTAAFVDAPHTDHTEQYIVDALRKAGVLTISLVAEETGAIVGHVAVSPVAVSDGSSGWYGLGPISVIPERQRQGVGTRLMNEALRLLRGKGAAGCVLLGDPAYYSRFGFRVEPRVALPNVPPGYFLVLPFGASLPCGEVAYHASFSARG